LTYLIGQPLKGGVKRETEVDLLHILFTHTRAELLRLLFRERAPEQHVRGLARESASYPA
jgi:hypothetical protein